MPAPTHQTAPVDAAEQPDDPVAVLQRVREALGPDPRVTRLEVRVVGLETEVAQQNREPTRPMPDSPLFKRHSMPDHSLEETG